MNRLFDHAHLLDGALARACAYMALAMLSGMQLWEWRLQRLLAWRQYFNWTAFALGSAALLLALNSAALSGEDAFNAAAMSVASPGEMLELLRFSAFGHAWLAYWLCLLAAVSCWKSWVARTACLAMLGALALASHAGELGMWNWTYWIDLAHMGCALLWLGGMSLMLVLRLADNSWMSLREFSFFSRVALPVFLLALASGAARAWLQYAEEGGLGWTYAAMLGLKLAAVAAIAACAWQLRRLLRQPGFSMAAYDNGLTLEFFFALVLVLFTSLLTQLPPD
ncbi:CopD family protein [Methylobacillus sp. Pita1]|uniref:CopD family protein n=1 Tax=Methylobacillus sp. Pita1 TaxID=3382642 RepID=UPI0038B62F8A